MNGSSSIAGSSCRPLKERLNPCIGDHGEVNAVDGAVSLYTSEKLESEGEVGDAIEDSAVAVLCCLSICLSRLSSLLLRRFVQNGQMIGAPPSCFAR